MNIFMGARAWRHSAGVALREEWNRQGHSVKDTPEHADVKISFTDIVGSHSLPTIVRFDNVYFHTGFDWKRKNATISKSHSAADGVVYQSLWSKEVHEAFCTPVKKGALTDIIFNGMKKGWNGKPEEHIGFNIIAASVWRRFKRLPEMIKIFREVHKRYVNTTLSIFGKFVRSDAINMDFERVFYYGEVTLDTLGGHYRHGDLFLHFSKGESCPRAVTEAIASGMPVMVLNDSGGAVEMITPECGKVIDCCTPFPKNKKMILQDTYSEEYAKIGESEKVITAICNFIENPFRAKLPEKLNIGYTAKQYINLMLKVLER